MGRKPKNLLHETYVPQGTDDIRMRLRIMTLNVGSFPGNKKLIECYVKDQRAHIVILTESNVTQTKIEDAEMSGFSTAGYCCRKEKGIKGGGGGGVVIFVRDSVPYTTEYDVVVKIKNELEHCAISVYPNYNYEPRVVVVGAYRPPKKRRPDFEAALKRMLQLASEQQCTTTLAGDFNINALIKEYQQ